MGVQIMAEMEQEDDDAEDDQHCKAGDCSSAQKASPSALMLAAGLASAHGSTAAKPMLAAQADGLLLKASTEAQPG